MINKQKSNLINVKCLLDIPEYIDQPECVKNKPLGYSFLILGWTLWLWLFLPFLTLILWWFEGNTIYQQLVDARERSPIELEFIRMVALSICALMSSLILWASYNWVRFYNSKRRQNTQPVTHEQLASSFNVSVKDIEILRQADNITLYYNDDGVLEIYNINPTKSLA